MIAYTSNLGHAQVKDLVKPLPMPLSAGQWAQSACEFLPAQLTLVESAAIDVNRVPCRGRCGASASYSCCSDLPVRSSGSGAGRICLPGSAPSAPHLFLRTRWGSPLACCSWDTLLLFAVSFWGFSLCFAGLLSLWEL